MNKSTATEIAVTWEMLNGSISDPVKTLLLKQLSQYDDRSLLKALARCRSECRGRISPADIISRIDDGRPGLEEAWATVDRAHRDQNATIVWTEEMSAAYGIIEKMVDATAARMSFKDAYTRLCGESRAAGRPVKWTPSLGSYDGRNGPLLEAVRLGRLLPATARRLVPELPPMAGEAPRLPPKDPEYHSPEKVSELVASVTDGIGGGE